MIFWNSSPTTKWHNLASAQFFFSKITVHPNTFTYCTSVHCTWLSLYFCVATLLFKYFFVYLIMLYCKCGYLFEKLLDYTKSGDKHINIKKFGTTCKCPIFILKTHFTLICMALQLVFWWGASWLGSGLETAETMTISVFF